MSMEIPIPQDNSLAAEKVRSFPQTPGVYLMKDAAGRVIYIGKAKMFATGRAVTSSRRPAKIRERQNWSWKSAISSISRQKTRSTPSLPKPGLLRTFFPSTTGNSATARRFPIWKSTCARIFPASRSPANRKGTARNFTGRFPIRGSCGGDPGAAKNLQVPHLHAGNRRRRQALAMVPPLPAAFHRAMHRALQFADLERRLSQGHQAAATGFRRQKRCVAEGNA